MKRIGPLAILIALIVSTSVQAEVRYTWIDTFSPAEQRKLRTWIDETVAGLEKLVGPYPFDILVHMHRADGAQEPVPWANTRRGSEQGVNFHVNASYSLDAFHADWTAPHELSHLVIPYLGPSHSWFSEGFASYMQYQVMQATRQLTPEEASQRYLARLDKASRDYRFGDRAFASAAPRLKEERKYPVMYWGGAAYFLQVDAALREQGKPTLREVLAEYLRCCRRDRKSLDALVTELDRISDSTEFTTHLTRFRTEPGFPRYDMLTP
jgi:hypothetical protein